MARDGYHRAMPKSKGRNTKPKKRPYVPRPPAPKKRPEKSPKWYGRMVVGTMLFGVLLIVLNYVGILPGNTHPLWLWGGLGLVGVGFIMATRLR